MRSPTTPSPGSTLPPSKKQPHVCNCGCFDTAATTVDVLVVDDDEGVRTSVSEILQMSGYSTREAKDGMAALELLKEIDVGLLVLDNHMPRLSGADLLPLLEDAQPVVFVSAFSEHDTPVGSDRAVFSHLQKPVPPLELLDVVGAALGR